MASNPPEGVTALNVDGEVLVDEPGRTEGVAVARATEGFPEDDADPMSEDEDCSNCGGEGFYYSCDEEFACIDPEGGCDLCRRRCDWCNPYPSRLGFERHLPECPKSRGSISGCICRDDEHCEATRESYTPVAPATATPQDSTSPATSHQSAATAAIGPPTNTTPTPVSADARSHKAPTRTAEE